MQSKDDEIKELKRLNEQLVDQNKKWNIWVTELQQRLEEVKRELASKEAERTQGSNQENTSRTENRKI